MRKKNDVSIFYLFQDKKVKTSTEQTPFLEKLSVSILKQKEMLLYEVHVVEKELYEAMTSMTQDNSPENDGLTKEFHSCFSEDLKYLPLLEPKNVEKEFNPETSYREKTYTEKKLGKRLTNTWRPISLQINDYKIVPKLVCVLFVSNSIFHLQAESC